MANIDFDKLTKELVPYRHRPTPKKSGLDRVVHYLSVLSSTKDIDYDSFSLEDVDNAVDELIHLPLDDDGEDESFIIDGSNKFGETLLNLNEPVTRKIQYNANKKYRPMNDDIFL